MAPDSDDATTVFVVDDRVVPRMAAKAMLAQLPGFRQVGEAANGAEALRAAPRLEPDLILVDVDMPGMDGPAVVASLRQALPKALILAWTISESGSDLIRMFRAGCIGYVLKDSTPEELHRALMATLRGEAPVPRRMLPSVLTGLAVPRPAISDIRLTDRERAVLLLLARGEARKGIAHHLGVAVTSVDTHVKNLYRKLEVSSQTEAVSVGLRLGLITVDEL